MNLRLQIYRISFILVKFKQVKLLQEILGTKFFPKNCQIWCLCGMTQMPTSEDVGWHLLVKDYRERSQ